MAMTEIKKEQAAEMLHTPFVKVYDLQYEEGRHYYDVSRREKEDLAAIKSETELKTMLPDAVSCVVVLDIPGEEPKLCVMREYRYPIGRYVLSVPSGLVDRSDETAQNPVFSAAEREVGEETGIRFDPATDEVVQTNPLLFCSPGLTDESTAVVKIVLHRDQAPAVSTDGAVGAEDFDGITWITKEQARDYIRQGTDNAGVYYSAITWIALMTFLSDLW